MKNNIYLISGSLETKHTSFVLPGKKMNSLFSSFSRKQYLLYNSSARATENEIFLYVDCGGLSQNAILTK